MEGGEQARDEEVVSLATMSPTPFRNNTGLKQNRTERNKTLIKYLRGWKYHRNKSNQELLTEPASTVQI